MPNQLGFSRPMSGPSIADIQKAVNSLYTASGVSEVNSGTQYNATPSTVPNGTNYQTAIQILAGKFSPTTGHFHTGAQGDGPTLATSAISNSPTFPLPVAASGVLGTSGSGFAWGNHQHQGVHSIGITGAPLYGDVILAGSGGAAVAVSGQTLVILAAAGVELHGSGASPILIAAGVGITPTTAMDQIWWVAPSSGSGQVVITATPPIAAGTTLGQRLHLKSVSGSNYLNIPAVLGVDQNGPVDMGPSGQAISYTWDSVNWFEDSRRV